VILEFALKIPVSLPGHEATMNALVTSNPIFHKTNLSARLRVAKADRASFGIRDD
jgi:hypothetical protein